MSSGCNYSLTLSTPLLLKTSFLLPTRTIKVALSLPCCLRSASSLRGLGRKGRWWWYTESPASLTNVGLKPKLGERGNKKEVTRGSEYDVICVCLFLIHTPSCVNGRASGRHWIPAKFLYVVMQIVEAVEGSWDGKSFPEPQNWSDVSLTVWRTSSGSQVSGDFHQCHWGWIENISVWGLVLPRCLADLIFRTCEIFSRLAERQPSSSEMAPEPAWALAQPDPLPGVPLLSGRLLDLSVFSFLTCKMGAAPPHTNESSWRWYELINTDPREECLTCSRWSAQ